MPETANAPDAKQKVKEAAENACQDQANVPPECKAVKACIPDAKGLTFAESKSASDIAYEGKKGEVYRFPDGKEWKVDDVIDDKRDSFRAVLLRPVDSATDKRAILAFAGSGSLKDIDTGLEQLYRTPGQYWSAQGVGNFYKRLYGDDLRMTGHSLGGSLASFASATNGGIPATAINALPLAGQTKHLAGIGTPNTQFYNTVGDPIHQLWGTQVGDSPINVYGEDIIPDEWEPPILDPTELHAYRLKRNLTNMKGRHQLKHTAPCIPPPVKVRDENKAAGG